MLVAVASFGSVWCWRFGKNQDDPYRFGRVAYFNTTGVQVGNEVRQRPKITGYACFNGCGGFDPNHLFMRHGFLFVSTFAERDQARFRRPPARWAHHISQTASSLCCGTRCTAH
mgnify:CR=1 FL=1